MDYELKIRALREAKGVSQRKLAEDIGVSPGAVAQWELGATTPTTANLVALANMAMYGLDLSQVMKKKWSSLKKSLVDLFLVNISQQLRMAYVNA